MGEKLAGVEVMEGITCLLGVPMPPGSHVCLDSGDQSIFEVGFGSVSPNWQG